MSKTSMKKIKFSKNGGLECHYVTADQNGEQKTMVEKNSNRRHPDLDEMISDLRVHVACIHGLLPEKYAGMQSFASLDDTEMEEVVNEIGKVTPLSITITGDDEDRGFLIGAKRQVFPGRYVACNTPIVKVDDVEYSKALEMATVCQNIIDESNKYVFDSKYAQLTLAEAPLGVEEVEDME